MYNNRSVGKEVGESWLLMENGVTGSLIAGTAAGTAAAAVATTAATTADAAADATATATGSSEGESVGDSVGTPVKSELPTNTLYYIIYFCIFTSFIHYIYISYCFVPLCITYIQYRTQHHHTYLSPWCSIFLYHCHYNFYSHHQQQHHLH
mmetsp:Transcript_17011/g.17050  ORF Transcript_17011/g.17050 Transcript_17011/m.17050 type:complete len:151 (-) Transcript_17011:29-481(-)